MRKLLAIILSVIACAFFAMGFAACGSHTHTYSDAWTYDNAYHWHAATCEHKEEISDKAEHVLVDGKCSVCGYEEKKEERDDKDDEITVSLSKALFNLAKNDYTVKFNDIVVAPIGFSANAELSVKLDGYALLLQGGGNFSTEKADGNFAFVKENDTTFIYLTVGDKAEENAETEGYTSTIKLPVFDDALLYNAEFNLETGELLIDDEQFSMMDNYLSKLFTAKKADNGNVQFYFDFNKLGALIEKVYSIKPVDIENMLLGENGVKNVTDMIFGYADMFLNLSLFDVKAMLKENGFDLDAIIEKADGIVAMAKSFIETAKSEEFGKKTIGELLDTLKENGIDVDAILEKVDEVINKYTTVASIVTNEDFLKGTSLYQLLNLGFGYLRTNEDVNAVISAVESDMGIEFNQDFFKGLPYMDMTLSDIFDMLKEKGIDVISIIETINQKIESFKKLEENFKSEEFRKTTVSVVFAYVEDRFGISMDQVFEYVEKPFGYYDMIKDFLTSDNLLKSLTVENVVNMVGNMVMSKTNASDNTADYEDEDEIVEEEPASFDIKSLLSMIKSFIQGTWETVKDYDMFEILVNMNVMEQSQVDSIKAAVKSLGMYNEIIKFNITVNENEQVENISFVSEFAEIVKGEVIFDRSGSELDYKADATAENAIKTAKSELFNDHEDVIDEGTEKTYKVNRNDDGSVRDFVITETTSYGYENEAGEKTNVETKVISLIPAFGLNVLPAQYVHDDGEEVVTIIVPVMSVIKTDIYSGNTEEPTESQTNIVFSAYVRYNVTTGEYYVNK